MKRTIKIMAMASVIGCLTFTCAWAQSESQTNNNNAHSRMGWRYGRLYNPQTVETIQGKVLSVQTITRGNWHAVDLQLKTDSGAIPVFLGPSWFIEHQPTQIKPNEEAKVTGSRTTVNGHAILLASQVRTDGQVLQLRDPNGRPVWVAWRPEHRQGPLLGQNINRPGMLKGGPMHQGMMSPGAMGGSSMEEPPMHGSMMGGGHPGKQMGCKCGHMMARHERIIPQLKKMEARLDKKVARMNEATGKEKIQAMSSAVNELVKQRDQLFNHIANARAGMMSHMREHRPQMRGAMGGSKYGMGGSGYGHRSSRQNRCQG